MVGSSRRRTLRRQRAAAAGRRRPPSPTKQPASDDVGIGLNIVDRLPPELLAEIHSYLIWEADFLQRLAFASVCGASGHLFKEEAPCLVLAGAGGTEENKARVFSLADRRAATVRAPDPAMRGHVVVGSSGGWLVTADARGALRMANPVTGAQADLPAITKGSIPFLGGGSNWWFRLDVGAFDQIRFGGRPSPGGDDVDYWGPVPPRTYTLTAVQLRQCFYRKVVLSADARPGRYAAMLILDRTFGAPAAFATAEHPEWRLAPSPDGVEDAIHHRGRFYSITCSGAVEEWARDAETGEFTSRVHAPALAVDVQDAIKLRRRYLAVGPGGRLMAVLKLAEKVRAWSGDVTTHVSFKVQVFDEARGRWEAAADIGSSALFVGVNASLCLPALENRGIRPSCIYFTDDEVGEACLCHEERGGAYDGEADDKELRKVGLYSLKHGNVEEIVRLGQHPRWPPPAWFTPSFL